MSISEPIVEPISATRDAPAPPTPSPRFNAPLAVDLDGTLVACDTLDESLAAALIRRPFATLMALLRGLFGGRAALKAALARLAVIDVDTLPYRADLIAYLHEQRQEGREICLATAADQSIAVRVAGVVGVFGHVYASDGRRNLKGRVKAELLAAEFPDGFSYAGDSRTDLAVWRRAASAIAVSSAPMARRVARVTTLERHVEARRGGWRAWVAAARPHQWTKNALVFAPVMLGWKLIVPGRIVDVVLVAAMFCVLSSLTYFINDIADLSADRRHATKRRRPFAAGSVPVRHGLTAATLGIPLVLAAAWAISPPVSLCLLGYCGLTFAYSAGLKRAPILDCMIIGGLFTLRLVTGVLAAQLGWSAWFLTFGFSFFCSLALAKRHAELVVHADGECFVPGRGYRYQDSSLTLALGAAASTTSIIILLLYLMWEAFPEGAYRRPEFLWAAPVLLFAWIGRIWLIANRGEMHDDPVVFALRDKVSLAIGTCVAAAFLIAVI